MIKVTFGKWTGTISRSTSHRERIPKQHYIDHHCEIDEKTMTCVYCHKAFTNG